MPTQRSGVDIPPQRLVRPDHALASFKRSRNGVGSILLTIGRRTGFRIIPNVNNMDPTPLPSDRRGTASISHDNLRNGEAQRRFGRLDGYAGCASAPLSSRLVSSDLESPLTLWSRQSSVS